MPCYIKRRDRLREFYLRMWCWSYGDSNRLAPLHRDWGQNQQGIAEALKPKKQGGLPGGREKERYSGVGWSPFPDLLIFLPFPQRSYHHKGTSYSIYYNCSTLFTLTTSHSVFILVIHLLSIILSFLQTPPITLPPSMIIPAILSHHLYLSAVPSTTNNLVLLFALSLLQVLPPLAFCSSV